MFINNNKLIENISNEFDIEKEEVNNIINNLFGNISLSILNGKKFYMDKLGVISIDDNLNVVLSNNEENFDESLESIDVKNNDIKNIFLEKSIYKSIFKNIKDISREEEVHIENFGYFHSSSISFKIDPIFQNIISIKFNKDDKDNSNINNDDLIKKLDTTLEDICNKEKGTSNNENKEVVEDILDELDNRANIENTHENYEEDMVEIVDDNNYNDDSYNEENDDSIDNNVIGNIWKNQSCESNIENNNEEEYNNNYTIDDIINSNENYIEDNIIEEDTIEDKEERENDYPEMKEHTKEELLDINNFDSSDLKNIDEGRIEENMEKEINDKTSSQEELLNASRSNEDLLETSKRESLEVLNKYENEIKNVQQSSTDSKKNNIQKKSSSLFGGILKVVCIIIFILIVGVIISNYYNKSSSISASNNVENQKLYDIVNTYFNEINSTSLSYITSKDMYYWDIAKSLYGDATYWPLIYSYNSGEYKISNIIKKGSSISYKSLQKPTSTKDIKLLNNTISKSYISIYPILVNDKKLSHSLWALKLSAYYDINVFKNNASIMPEQTYNDILRENNGIKNIYSDMVNNENVFVSFIENIKQKLGI
ncbi:hypothetical protein R4K55_10385 [Brachyspira alvinipulli]|uniref:hypothetical protein n=1 Tax=Brachyspira alvinipulli TaxID=84379 RepID=UPI002612751B|nr:hypothetical protein [uncultured Brachyspira sp.]